MMVTPGAPSKDSRCLFFFAEKHPQRLESQQRNGTRSKDQSNCCEQHEKRSGVVKTSAGINIDLN
jgi:hypothetical protein